AQRQDTDLPVPGAALRGVRGELPADRRGIRQRHATRDSRIAKVEAVRAHDRARAAEADSEGEEGTRPLLDGAAGSIRAARGREDLQALRDSVRGYDRVLDRGNREPNPG